MDGFKKWLRERVPVEALNYQVPPHANTLLFSLGGITLISLIVVIVTGVILAQFYVPSPEEANASIRLLVTEVKLGSLVRGIHYWAAQILMLSLILHLLRVFLYGSYKKPREVNWLIGVVLFLGMIGLYFTGTILKWDQEAYEALAHAQELGAMLGPLGFYFNENFAPAVSLLGKFFTLHTSVLPIFLLALVGLHLLLVKALGISPLPWPAKQAVPDHGQHTFLEHARKLGGYGLVALGLMAILAVFFPPSLGPSPVEGIEATKPPWLFMSIFSLENWFGLEGLLAASALLAVGLVLVPFLDRKPKPDLAGRKPILAVGVLAVLLVVGLTANAYTTKPEQHIGMGEEAQAAQTEPGAEPQAEPQNGQPEAESSGQEQPQAPATETSPELAQLDQALQIAVNLESSLAQSDFKAALEKSKELDKTLDAIGDKIKAKDAAVRKEIGDAVHELEELLEKTSPDVGKVKAMLADAVNGIKKARELFSTAKVETPESKEVQALNQSLEILAELGTALDAGDLKLARQKAVDLDTTLDAIGDKIKAKDAALRKEIGDTVHELEELLEKTAPDVNKVRTYLTTAESKINEAQKLFQL